jgi:nucleoside-diphosphate-sugar epimerase
VAEIAEVVRHIVGPDVSVVNTPTDNNHSYHISSEKIKRELGFIPQHTIGDAVQDLVAAFREGKIPNPMTDIRYYNIKTMQALKLK